MQTPQLTQSILTAALDGLELQKSRIEDQIAQVRSLLGGAPRKPVASAEASGEVAPKRTLSAAARRSIATAQKKRWALIRKQKASGEPAAKVEAKPAKRKLSAAGRRAIIEATKKRWAKVRAEAAKAKKAAEAK
jgi:hypothetical protein